jgi:hypothetical protein
MKLLLLSCLFLSGCSLIKINEAQQAPKVRPQFIGVTEIVGTRELQTRVSVAEIIEYWDEEGKLCRILLRNAQPVDTNSPCNDIDGLLRK